MKTQKIDSLHCSHEGNPDMVYDSTYGWMHKQTHAKLLALLKRESQLEGACVEMRKVLELVAPAYDDNKPDDDLALALRELGYMAHRVLNSSNCGRSHIPASEFDKTIEALKIARRAMEWHAWNKSSDHDCIEFVAIRAVNDDIFRLESLRKESK